MGKLFSVFMLLISSVAVADTKVVIIPMGGDDPAKKTIFITSTTYNGNLVTAANQWLTKTYNDSLTAGDALCQSRADVAGLQGSYRAWLSTEGTDAIDRLSITAGAYYKVDGTLVAKGRDELITTGVRSSINLTEYGLPPAQSTSNVFPSKVWTGTTASGVRSVGSTCSNWTTESGNSNTGIAGSTLPLQTWSWTFSSIPACVNFLALYCLEY